MAQSAPRKKNIKRWSDAKLNLEIAIAGAAFDAGHVEAIEWWKLLCVEHVRRQTAALAKAST